MSNHPLNNAPVITTPLLIGVLITTVLGVAIAKESGVLESGAAKRIIGIAFGVILTLAGNMLPKLVLPLNAHRQNPARAIAVERIAGWTFTLTGIAYVCVWIFSPPGPAMLISSVIGLGAFTFVGAAYIWLARSRRSREQHNEKEY